VKSLGNGFFDAANKGAEEAAKELGDVDIIYTGPTKATAEAQIEVINSLIAQKVNAIAISANDADALVPALKKAMERGITVISWDSGVAPEGRQLHLNPSDTGLIGETIIKLAADYLPEGGDVAILSASSTATNQNAWIDAAKKVLPEKFPKINLVATVSNACTTGTFVLSKMITVGEPIPGLSIEPAHNCYYDVLESVPLGSTAVQYSSNGSTWTNAAIGYRPDVGGYAALIEGSVEGPVTLTYYVRSVNSCGTGPSARKSINVPKPRSGSCGLVVVNSLATSVYPNPSTGLVTVSLPAASSLVKGTTAKAPELEQAITIKRISIYSIDGKLLKQFQFSSDNRQATIDLSALPNGNYLLESGNDFYQKTQQIVILH